MRNDYIRREDAVGCIRCNITVTGRQNAELIASTIGTFADRIKALPSADVVQVVRCRDCKECEYETMLDLYYCIRGKLMIGRKVMPDDFCSYGEKREE